MSILIKGMEMPPTCEQCPFCDYEQAHCLVHDIPTSKNRYDKREAWCPLVEVPPHGRLIDADAFYEVLDGGFDLDFDELPETKRELLRMIVDAPTIIDAEVDDGDS